MIQLRSDVALELHDQFKNPKAKTARKQETKQLLALAKKLKVRLQPVHPGQTHPLLAPHFMIEVPEEKTAAQLVERLQGIAGVEASYIKPEEEPA